MKMRMNKYIAGWVLVLSFISVGCSDFLDINENPNDPSVSTPRLNLPVAQQNFVALNARQMTYLGQFMAGHWATPSNWSANESLIRYNVTSNFYVDIFEDSYLNIFKDLTFVENFVDETGSVDYSAYKVISYIIKAFQYQYLVDLYGDVPYSEANQRGAIPTPQYDGEEDVYKANIQKLTEAAELALNLPDNAENPGAQDIIFGGDMEKWAQFANSIKLRYLIRMSSGGNESFINQEMAAINSNGAGFITETVSANPGYSDNTDKQNPFYGYFRQAASGSQTDRNDYTVASEYSMASMESKNDPRLERLYAEAANGGYKGAPQTTTLPGEGFTSNDLSKVGPGLLTSSAQDQPVMLLSELYFLLSEAALKGIVEGGEEQAKAYYETAVTESFIFLGVPDAETAAADYLGQEGTPNVHWDSTPDKLEAIITQKWIALNGTSSIECWIELTRTGFPNDIPFPQDVTDNQRPVRLLYPVSEAARNSNNVPKQTAGDAFTNTPFWNN